MKELVLVTGAAGFIGSHLTEKLLALGYRVLGLDNFDDFYPREIKRGNIRSLQENSDFLMVEGDIRDSSLLTHIFTEHGIDMVAHLAGRAGVRPSLDNPVLYEDVNVRGTINLLEMSRTFGVKRFVFASSSSVYGLKCKIPFIESEKVDCPASPYGVSKAAAEIYCHTYAELYHLPVAVLRLFTVYGPRQRPEMAIHAFTRMIDAGEEIPFFGDGTTKRDYTFVDDIVAGFLAALADPDPGFEIYNLGNSHPVELKYLVHLIEEALGKKAKINRLSIQPGDMMVTFADISKAETGLGYHPDFPIEKGVSVFVKWYLQNKLAARRIESIN